MSTAEIIAELPRLSPAELAQVQAKVRELVQPTRPPISTGAAVGPAAVHPALGIWKDRADLPQDPAMASRLLREQMMRTSATPLEPRNDAAAS